MKTHKGAKKRFKKTAKGKYKRKKTKKSHLLTKKTGNKKRNLRKSATVEKADEKKLDKLLPYE
jgi:large subunit ribosomal protein L35